MMRFDFCKEQFNRLFPFYVAFNEQLQITGSGRSFIKLLGDHQGKGIDTVLKIYKPGGANVTWTYLADITPNLVILSAIGSDILLRGQVERLSGADEFIFIGSPWFNDIDELTKHGLTMQDFAVHDSTIDSLHLLKANEMSKVDALKIADDLKDGRQFLKDSNQKLEIALDEQKKLESALVTTVNRLSTILKSLDSAVLVETKERTIALVNEAFCDIFSVPVPPEMMIGADCSQSAEQTKHLFADPEQFVIRILEILEHKVPVRDEVLHLADGRVLSRTYMPIHIDDQYEGHLWKYDDITTRFESDRKIAQQKEFYEKILNEIPADIAIFSPEHKYLFINRFGIKNEVVRNWIINKDDYDYCEYRGKDISIAHERRRTFNTVIQTKNSISFTDEIINAEGDKTYVLRIFYPYVNDNNEVEFVIGYGIDLTQQKRHELQLEQQQYEQRELLEVMTDGIFRCDNDLNINFYNKAFVSLSGIDTQAKPVKIYEIIHEASHDELKQKLDTLVHTGQRQQAIVKLAAQNTIDKETYVDLVIGNMDNHYSGEHFIGGRISDITETVFRERNLEQHVKEEKDLNDLKTRFIRITSHELRTPLAVILANTELMGMVKGDNAEAMRAKMLSRITNEVDRMTQILNELLLASKMENGEVEFDPRPGNMAALLRALKHELYDPYFDGRVLELHVPDTPPMWDFDEKLLRHILVNLINNAFKYSTGKPVPRVTMLVKDDKLIIAVKDEGIGIPAEEIKNLSRSFFRASNVGTVAGTGLGLMIVSYMVGLHKGTLSIDSKVNEGSTFTISLPRTFATNG